MRYPDNLDTADDASSCVVLVSAMAYALLHAHTNKQTDSISHPFGAKSDLVNPFKNPMDESDDYDLDEYLAEKSKNQNTRMSEIASIIRSVKKSEFRNSE